MLKKLNIDIKNKLQVIKELFKKNHIHLQHSAIFRYRKVYRSGNFTCAMKGSEPYVLL